MSSTVQQHQKESEMSSTVPQHLKEDEKLSTVPQHQKEDEMSSKVPQHLKENKLSSTARRGRKEKLRFRERNGAAYQVPDNWEDLYDGSTVYERTPSTKYVKEKRHTKNKNTIKEKSVEIEKSENCEIVNNSCDKQKPDYYTALQKDISDDIALVNKTGIPKNTRNKRWNRKHQNEIDFDKSMLCTWVEHGVTGWAEAPRYTKSTDEKFVDSVYENTKKSLTHTLGDFMPKFKSKSPQMVPTLGDYVPSFKNDLGEKQSLKVVNVNGDEVKLTPNQSENFLLALKNGNSNAKSCFNAYNTKIEDGMITLTLPYDVSDDDIVQLIETVSKPIDNVPFNTNPGNTHSLEILNVKGEKVKLTPIQNERFLFALKHGNPNAKACVDALNIDPSVTSCDHYTQYSEYDKKEIITLKFPCEMSDNEMTTFIEMMSKPFGVVFNQKDKPTLTHEIFIDVIEGRTALTKLTSRLISDIIQDITSAQDEYKSTVTTESHVDAVEEKITSADLSIKQISDTVREHCRSAVQEAIKLAQEKGEDFNSPCDSCFEIEDSNNGSEKRKRIPLCIHGIHFQVNRFNEFYFKEAERMLDNIPFELVTEFADQINSFYSVFNSLRFDNIGADIFECNSVYCRWRDDISDIQRSHLEHEIFNSASFEVKAVRVLGPRYRLRNLTIDEDDPSNNSYSNDRMMGRKYKKALESLEFDKRNNLSKHMRYFINQLYRETFTLVESLPEKDSRPITIGINKLAKFIYRRPHVDEKSNKNGPLKIGTSCPLGSDRCEEYEDDSYSICSSAESVDTFETMISAEKISKSAEKLVSSINKKHDTKDIKNIPESFLPMIMVENISCDIQSVEKMPTSDIKKEVDKNEY